MTSMRLFLLRWIHRLLNKAGQRVSEDLRRYETHTKPILNVNFGSILSVHNDAAARQINNTVTLPVLSQDINKQSIGTVINNGDFLSAQIKALGHSQHTPEMLEKMRQWNAQSAGSDVMELIRKSSKSQRGAS